MSPVSATGRLRQCATRASTSSGRQPGRPESPGDVDLDQHLDAGAGRGDRIGGDGPIHGVPGGDQRRQLADLVALDGTEEVPPDRSVGRGLAFATSSWA